MFLIKKNFPQVTQGFIDSGMIRTQRSPVDMLVFWSAIKKKKKKKIKYRVWLGALL